MEVSEDWRPSATGCTRGRAWEALGDDRRSGEGKFCVNDLDSSVGHLSCFLSIGFHGKPFSSGKVTMAYVCLLATGACRLPREIVPVPQYFHLQKLQFIIHTC